MKPMTIMVGFLGALAGGRAGFGAMSRSDPVYVSYVLANPHASWNLLSWLRFFEPVIGGAVLGGVIGGVVLPLMVRRVNWATLGVGRAHVLAGTLCGLAWALAAGVVLAGPLLFLGFMMPIVALLLALASVVSGAIGASLLTHLVYGIRKANVGIGWAALGGFLGGPVGLSLAWLLALALFP